MVIKLMIHPAQTVKLLLILDYSYFGLSNWIFFKIFPSHAE